MDRTWEWRSARSRRWIERRRKYFLNVLDMPERKEGRPQWDTIWIFPEDWLWTQTNRLNKYTFSCDHHDICRWDRIFRSFHYQRREFCRMLDRSEDQKGA